ncbi:hypothetical protein ACGRHY_29250 [Streptomyces sp. HK10]|uniref:hypothetical protein n=1 Tax=Streptomyces sp. HK10 TaxID=3373255 RepID=UPI003747D5D4
MADHDDSERKYTFLGVALLGAHIDLRGILRDLPIPVELPELDEENKAEALVGLDRARTLIADEPISSSAKRAFQELILEWFTAYEVLALYKAAGFAPWRLDAVEFALSRFVALSEMIEEGDYGPPETDAL